MTPLFRRMLHAGVVLSAIFKGIWGLMQRLFRSRADVARRASGKFEALKRREMELERLDRLRHPSDYRCR